jgi:hypothetical protein
MAVEQKKEYATPAPYSQPLFLYIKCDPCKKLQKLTDFKTGIVTVTRLNKEPTRIRSVYGNCPDCGKELSHDITTEAQISKLVYTTQKQHEREVKKTRKDKEKTVMATDTKKKSAKAAKSEAKPEKKVTKGAKAEKSEKSSKKAATATVSRDKKYGERLEGMPNGKDSMEKVLDGEMLTVEQFNKEYTAAAKKKEVLPRLVPWTTSDLAWAVNNIDGVVQGYDDNGNRIFGKVKVKNGKYDGRPVTSGSIRDLTKPGTDAPKKSKSKDADDEPKAKKGKKKTAGKK